MPFFVLTRNDPDHDKTVSAVVRAKTERQARQALADFMSDAGEQAASADFLDPERSTTYRIPNSLQPRIVHTHHQVG